MTLLSEMLADSPWGLWRAADASGLSAPDASGNGHDGTLSGSGVAIDPSGLYLAEPCFTFDGSGGVITIPGAVDLPAGDYTLVAVTTSALGGGSRGGAVGYGLWGSTGEANYLVVEGTTVIHSVWYSNDLDDTVSGLGTGAHLVATRFDGTTRQAWLDTAAVGSGDTPGSPAFDLTQNVLLGLDGGSESFDGKLDYLAIFPTKLSDARLSAYYAALTNLIPDAPTGLTATPNSGTGAIDLAWTAPASGPTPDSYTIERSTTTGTETSYHTGVIGTSYSDTGVVVGTHYYYTILSHTTAGGDSTASGEANAIAPAISVSTVTVQNTCMAINSTPASGSTAISLLTPDDVTPKHSATGKALTILTFDPSLDNTGFWSEALIPTGDMTPPGCIYQFTEPGGRTTNLSFAYADGPTITLSDHYPTQQIFGQIKAYLAGLDIGGLIDATLPLTAAISADAVWVGGAGIGQLISSNKLLAFAPDGAGNASVYVVRNSELSTGPTSNPYLITNTRSGISIAFLAPDTYDDVLLGYVDQGVYSGPTTYAIGDVVRDPSTDVPYRSRINGNIGHSPASSPTQWAPHPGVRITDHAVLPGSSVSPVATESMIATISFAARHHATPTTVQEHFEELAYRTWLASWGALQPPMTMSALHVYL